MNQFLSAISHLEKLALSCMVQSANIIYNCSKDIRFAVLEPVAKECTAQGTWHWCLKM
jgi:hypothetical protein